MLMWTWLALPLAPTTSRHLLRSLRPGWTRVAETAVRAVRRVQRSMVGQWQSAVEKIVRKLRKERGGEEMSVAQEVAIYCASDNAVRMAEECQGAKVTEGGTPVLVSRGSEQITRPRPSRPNVSARSVRTTVRSRRNCTSSIEFSAIMSLLSLGLCLRPAPLPVRNWLAECSLAPSPPPGFRALEASSEAHPVSQDPCDDCRCGDQEHLRLSLYLPRSACPRAGPSSALAAWPLGLICTLI